MGYAKSLQAFERARKYLDVLKRSREPVKWSKLHDPKRVQYVIHNGLYAAEYFKIPYYMDLRNLWRVSYRDDYVIAVPRLREDEGTVQYTDIKDPFSIVEKLAKLKDADTTIEFIDPGLAPAEYNLIINWCSANNRVSNISPEGNLIVSVKHE